MRMKRYHNEQLQNISFPLGGIGSGSIGLAGNGALIDWEIFNRPNKQSINGFSHFAIRAEKGEEVIAAKVLHGRCLADLTGSPENYGFGPRRETLGGLPHFQKTKFEAAYPLAKVEFEDASFPGKVQLHAFNPMIPLNDRDSSLPAAFFAWEIENNCQEELSYTLAFCITSPWSENVINFVNCNNMPILTLRNTAVEPDDINYGDLTISTDAADISYQKYWFKGKSGLFDNLTVYWREFLQPGRFVSRECGTNHSLLAAHFRLVPGEKKTVRFILAWNVPNFYNYWQPFNEENPLPQGVVNKWKNYYATQFEDSKATAVYALENWSRLDEETRRFANALYDSSLPEAVLDAAGANISILKSPTCVRLEDGSFYGFEGCASKSGCCEGSCSHVWNYAYALPFLFPALERSMRNLEYHYNLRPDGGMPFRLLLPLGRKNEYRPCADGQFGNIIKVYREWRMSGDNDWLKRLWPKVKQSLEYAWHPDNSDRWDPKQQGVITGRQHHTLDMELFGPNSWLTGFYLAALLAGAEIAEFLGENDTMVKYRKIYQHGREFLNRELFNGEYYQQKVELKDRAILDPYRDGQRCVFDPDESIYDSYWDDEHQEIKYQIGDGCHIDQMLAQWHAGIIDLGEIFEYDKAVSALKSVYHHNFQTSFHNVFNPCRLFTVENEAGTMICTWPKNKYKQWVPIPYSQETMSGFEYAVAGQMMQYGMIREGLQLTQAVRDRYNGKNRNPWNEVECGSNYARSMASWAFIPILSGFFCDLPNKRLRFNPKINPNAFCCFWSCGTGWGVFQWEKNEVSVEVLYGEIELKELILPFASGIDRVTTSERDVACQTQDSTIKFDVAIKIPAGNTLEVQVRTA